MYRIVRQLEALVKRKFQMANILSIEEKATAIGAPPTA